MKRFLLIGWSLLALHAEAQVQLADTGADLRVEEPRFPEGRGPRLLIDAAHANYHVASGRFGPFAQLARNDGFQVGENQSRLSPSGLAGVDVLVIANATPHEGGSSFSLDEITALRRYVEQGGSLLLIADHTPYPAAVQDLALAFDVHFLDVYAEDDGRGLFTARNGGLARDTLTEGIERVRTFAGSAFTIEGRPHRPLLMLHRGWTLQSMTKEGLSEKSPADGLLQGAVFTYGAGRVAVFGEAAMFTAQTADGRPIGLHAKHATGNKQFILNVLRWLGDEGER